VDEVEALQGGPVKSWPEEWLGWCTLDGGSRHEACFSHKGGPMSSRIASGALAALVGIVIGAPGARTHSARRESYVVCPVGRVHKGDAGTTIEVEPAYQEALLGLEGFSHVWVIWWFDRNDSSEKRSVLRVHPRGNRRNPLTGVFATRSPARPNLIALTLCRIREIRGHTVFVESIDAFDDTPVLDLKPYIPRSDAVQRALVPSWIDDE
jgi:tRNA-Thr(GGU) m(6)t(6)A37 methyltransferase TsaA